MFRSKIKSKKSKSKGLLNLALQDAEWLVTEGDNVTVDIKDKNIELTSRRVKGDISEWQIKRDKEFNKAVKIIALAEAKYGTKRNMLGVKHLHKDYIDMATKLSVYWYVEKKAFPKYNMSNKLTHYVDYLNDHGSRTGGIKSMYRNEKSPRSIAKAIINDPYLCIRGTRSSIVYSFGDMFSDTSSAYYTADNSQLKSRIQKITYTVRTAYDMAMSVRKDAKAFPNRKIKDIAQYLSDELEDFNLYAPLVSDTFDEIGNVELDLQGMDFDDEINDKVSEAISYSYRHADSSNEEDIRWAKMEMVYPPLVQSLGTRVLGKSKKNSDIGVNPKNMHRRLTDNKVFQVKAKRKSGTVLIDVSGSMHLDTEDIFEIISTLPASTVAIYSGMSYPSHVEPHEVKGQLQIVGKDGKYVGEIPEHGLNNLIDGPAIDWLSKQAEPRILVSDLLFTGVNYNRTSGGEVGVTTELLADTLKVIATKNILPIPDIEKAKEWVRRFGGREE